MVPKMLTQASPLKKDTQRTPKITPKKKVISTPRKSGNMWVDMVKKNIGKTPHAIKQQRSLQLQREMHEKQEKIRLKTKRKHKPIAEEVRLSE